MLDDDVVQQLLEAIENSPEAASRLRMTGPRNMRGYQQDFFSSSQARAIRPQTSAMTQQSPLGFMKLGERFGTLGAVADMGSNFIIPPLLQNSGYTATYGHTNMMDVIRRQEQKVRREAAVRAATNQDVGSMMGMAEGLADLTGMSFNSKQRQATESVLRTVAPFLASNPQLADALTGRRGSAGAMAGQLGISSEFMRDSVTGGVGMTGESIEALQKNLFDSLYSGDRYQEMRGLKAGGAGELFRDLQSRGLMNTGRTNLREATRTAVRTQAEAQGLSEGDYISKTIGGASRSFQDLEQSELKELREAAEVQSTMRDIDTDKLSNKLRGYTKALTAMKEVFGDNGRPDAPVSELMGAIESFVGRDSMQNFTPEQLEREVRTMQAYQKRTGMGINEAAGIAQSNRALVQQMGLAPSTVSQLNSFSFAAHAAAQRDGAPVGFNTLSAEAIATRQTRNYASANASEMSKLHGYLALKIRDGRLNLDAPAGSQERKDAERMQAISEAAQRGEATATLADGSVVSTRLGRGDIRRMASGLKETNVNDISAGMYSTEVAEEIANNADATVATLRVQRNENMDNALFNASASAASLLQEQAKAGTQGLAGSTERDRVSLERKFRDAYRDSLNTMSSEERSNGTQRRAILERAIKDTATDSGVNLSSTAVSNLQTRYESMSSQYEKWRTGEDTASVAQLAEVHSTSNLQAILQERSEARVQSTIRAGAAKLYIPQGGILARVMESVEQIREDGDEMNLANLGLGVVGVKNSRLGGDVTDARYALKAVADDMRDLSQRIAAEKSPEKRKQLQAEYGRMTDEALPTAIKAVQHAHRAAGVDVDLTQVDEDELEKTANSMRRARYERQMRTAKRARLAEDITDDEESDALGTKLTQKDLASLEASFKEGGGADRIKNLKQGAAPTSEEQAEMDRMGRGISDADKFAQAVYRVIEKQVQALKDADATISSARTAAESLESAGYAGSTSTAEGFIKEHIGRKRLAGISEKFVTNAEMKKELAGVDGVTESDFRELESAKHLLAARGLAQLGSPVLDNAAFNVKASDKYHKEMAAFTQDPAIAKLSKSKQIVAYAEHLYANSPTEELSDLEESVLGDDTDRDAQIRREYRKNLAKGAGQMRALLGSEWLDKEARTKLESYLTSASRVKGAARRYTDGDTGDLTRFLNEPTKAERLRMAADHDNRKLSDASSDADKIRVIQDSIRRDMKASEEGITFAAGTALPEAQRRKGEAQNLLKLDTKEMQARESLIEYMQTTEGQKLFKNKSVAAVLGEMEGVDKDDLSPARRSLRTRLDATYGDREIQGDVLSDVQTAQRTASTRNRRVQHKSFTKRKYAERLGVTQQELESVLLSNGVDFSGLEGTLGPVDAAMSSFVGSPQEQLEAVRKRIASGKPYKNAEELRSFEAADTTYKLTEMSNKNQRVPQDKAAFLDFIAKNLANVDSSGRSAVGVNRTAEEGADGEDTKARVQAAPEADRVSSNNSEDSGTYQDFTEAISGLREAFVSYADKPAIDNLQVAGTLHIEGVVQGSATLKQVTGKTTS